MTDPDKPTSEDRLRSLAGTMMLLAFGLGILGFLIAIDRPQWFHIRPVSGTAAALAHAARDYAAADGEGERRNGAPQAPSHLQ